MYIIVNKDNGILNIGDVPLFGKKVTMMACFLTEEDALNTLYEIEKAGITDHRIENFGADFVIDSIPAPLIDWRRTGERL